MSNCQLFRFLLTRERETRIPSWAIEYQQEPVSWGKELRERQGASGTGAVEPNLVSPPSLILIQKGSPRTYQDIIHRQIQGRGGELPDSQEKFLRSWREELQQEVQLGLQEELQQHLREDRLSGSQRERLPQLLVKKEVSEKESNTQTHRYLDIENHMYLENIARRHLEGLDQRRLEGPDQQRYWESQDTMYSDSSGKRHLDGLDKRYWESRDMGYSDSSDKRQSQGLDKRYWVSQDQRQEVKYSQLESEDTWSGSSDWVGSRLQW